MLETSPFLEKVSKIADCGYPTTATIEVTNRCNARCSYCFLEDRISSVELSTEQIHTVIDKLSESTITMLTITGGEPFLRRDIIEILEHCCNANFFVITVYSNGTVLQDKHLATIIKYKDVIKPFRMTAFSHDEKIHDAYMGIPGALKKIITTGKMLMQEGVQVGFALPLMDFNYRDFDTSMEYFSDLGFSIGVNFAKLITDNNDSPDMRYMLSEEFYTKVFAQYSDERIRIIYDTRLTDNQSNKLCQGLRSEVMIDVHGNMHPCVATRLFTIGSIFEARPVHEICRQSEQLQKLCSITKDDLECKSCAYSTICGPCLGQSLLLSGSIYGPYTQNCNYAKVLHHYAEGKCRS
jgi:radical SAM protein with 4Fe4S-binding SPASM domain